MLLLLELGIRPSVFTKFKLNPVSLPLVWIQFLVFSKYHLPALPYSLFLPCLTLSFCPATTCRWSSPTNMLALQLCTVTVAVCHCCNKTLTWYNKQAHVCLSAPGHGATSPPNSCWLLFHKSTSLHWSICFPLMGWTFAYIRFYIRLYILLSRTYPAPSLLLVLWIHYI